MQLYAPVDAEPAAFHRALYVFVSPHGGDLHRPGAVRIFRSQLPRDNFFYPDEPATVGGPLQELTDDQQAAYDGRGDRWSHDAADSAPHTHERRVFPEYELVVEPEEFADEDELPPGVQVVGPGAGAGVELGTGTEAGTEVTGTEGTEGTKETEGTGTEGIEGIEGTGTKATLAAAADAALPKELRGKGADVSAKHLRELEKMQDKDQVQLSQFHLRLQRSDAEQVVRYCFEPGAKPLWPSITHAPAHSPRSVPPCQRCGAARQFEFQVLPQIINHLGVDSELASAVDFGSIAVYTCSASCSLGGGGGDPGAAAGSGAGGGLSAAYAEEVALVHPPLNA